MTDKDPSHWLHRLDAAEWLAAAENELRLADEAYARRAVRPAVTHARRAAGMALNALLVRAPHDRWGRSYMEHVIALASDESAPADVLAGARQLRDTPALQPQVIRLGKPDTSAVDAARAIVEWARGQLSVNG